MRLRRLLSLLSLSLLAACSGAPSSGGPAGDLPPRDAEGFALQAADSSFACGGHADFSYAASDSADGVVLDVSATAATGLRAAYFELYYDPAQFTPVAAAPTGLLSGSMAPELAGPAAAPEGLLALAVLDRPGVVHYGEVLAHWDQRSGFSGSGVVARLHFARRAFSGGRTVSTPPLAFASQAPLVYDSGAGAYQWPYTSQGDCDQNGEVNISDLTPLGLHFGAAGPFAQDSALSLVDADGNGEINIADLTPIGANFGSAVEGYRLFISSSASDYPAAPDGPNGAGAAQVGEALFPAGSLQDYPEQRRYFSLVAAGPAAGELAWVRPAQGSALGIASSPVGPAAAANQAPLAAISGTSSGGAAPLGIDFTAAASTDPDGDPLTYRWDLDGDGVLETDTGASPLMGHSYFQGGVFNASVTVTDSSGLSDSAYMAVTITGGGPNVPPNITAVTCDPNPISSGGRGLVRVVFADPDVVGYSGSVVPDAGTIEFAPSPGLPLTLDYFFTAPVVAVDTAVNLACEVDDGQDSDTENLVVTVLAPQAGNSPPGVGGITIAPDPLPGGDTGNITLTASDIDGDPLSVTWVHNGSNGYITGSGLSVDYHSYTLAAIANVTVTAWIDDQHGHSVSQPLSFQVVPAANDPPTVSLGADFTSGARPLSVNFTATASDPDGDALTYSWDFDDNGSEDLNSGGVNTANNIYDLGGSYTARVTVDDGHANSATDSISVSVTPSWSATTIDATVNSGLRSSLVDRAGVPGVAYYFFDGIAAFQTQYLEGADPFGSSWAGGVIAPGGGDGMAAVYSAGVLGMGVYDTGGGTPCTFNRYAGPGSVLTANLSLLSGEGLHMSGADINGQPALAWCYMLDANTYELHYARATDAASDIWNPAQSADAATNFKLGFHNSLALISGRPAIAYSDNTSKSVLFVRASDAAGSGWGGFVVVASPPGAEDYSGECALVDAGGQPGVFFLDAASGQIWYKRALDADGANWAGAPQSMQTGCNGELDATLVGGLPALAYVESGTGWLRYQRLSNLDGTAVEALENVDTSTGCSAPSLREVGGYPAVSFYDSTNLGVKYGVKY